MGQIPKIPSLRYPIRQDEQQKKKKNYPKTNFHKTTKIPSHKIRKYSKVILIRVAAPSTNY